MLSSCQVIKFRKVIKLQHIEIHTTIQNPWAIGKRIVGQFGRPSALNQHPLSGFLRSEAQKFSVDETVEWNEFQETEGVIDTLPLVM